MGAADDVWNGEIPPDARTVCRACRRPTVLSPEALERARMVNAMQKRKGYSGIEIVGVCPDCETTERDQRAEHHLLDVDLAQKRRKEGT